SIVVKNMTENRGKRNRYSLWRYRASSGKTKGFSKDARKMPKAFSVALKGIFIFSGTNISRKFYGKMQSIFPEMLGICNQIP
ncbi:MAG: hypothetical protein KKE04_01610, partial [Candidatus Thermoplasmatota archaeon]|nr:hypothetical protein [Candidatus Thermoplasmatota archaeon]